VRIIQLIQRPQRRGAEIFAVQLAEELLLRGHEILVIGVFPGPDGLAFTGQMITLDRPPARRLYDIKGWRALARLIRKWKPDLIQANAADTLKFATLSKKIFRWKCPIIYRNANQMGDFIRGNFHRMFNQFLLNSVDSVISVSNASRTDFHHKFKFPEIHAVVIPIGIDPEKIELELAKAENTQLFPFPYLIQIGSWVPEKDPLAMLDIFKDIRIVNPALHLVFLGSGVLERQLRDKIDLLGLDQVVHLIPNQANIFIYLQHAEALIMPSRIEGLPGVILEAMYCKVPVVAFGVGGIPEVLVSGKTGFCVKPGDSMAFEKSILHLLNLSANQKEDLQDAAHSLVVDSYSLRKIAVRFEDFYRKRVEGWKV